MVIISKTGKIKNFQVKKLGRKIWLGAQTAVFTASFLLAEKARAITPDGLIDKPTDIFNPTKESGPTGGFAKNFGSVDKIVTFIFNTVIGISAAIFVIMLLIGGVTYLTGAGNEEQTGKGKKMLLDAIIGLFIVMAAWGIGSWVLTQFGYIK